MRFIIFVLLVFTSSISMAGSSMTVVYFLGTNQYPLTNAASAAKQGFELKQFNMDGHLNLEKKLSEGLPQNDLEQAEKIANERLEKMDWSMLQTAFQGLALASAWDIKKLPAFVFAEGKFVVYGVTSAKEAISRWKSYQGRSYYRSTTPYQ